MTAAGITAAGTAMAGTSFSGTMAAGTTVAGTTMYSVQRRLVQRQQVLQHLVRWLLVMSSSRAMASSAANNLRTRKVHMSVVQGKVGSVYGCVL